MTVKLLPKDIFEIRKTIDAIPKQIKDLKEEIAGKQSILDGAYSKVEKGHPHFKQKKWLERHLDLDQEQVVSLEKHMAELKKLLYEDSLKESAGVN